MGSLLGEVTIAESVAVAAGVVCIADPGSQLVIEAGVCLGSGTVLHAQGGVLSVGAGAVLGPRVLIVGAGTVAAGACIGAETTLIDPEVGIRETIASGTLAGDRSRYPAAPTGVAPLVVGPPVDASPEGSPAPSGQPEAVKALLSPPAQPNAPPSTPLPLASGPPVGGDLEVATDNGRPLIPGEAYLRELRQMLLPPVQRQKLAE